ncbi:hypothetical protein UYSO10_3001 [Kosakonia radicincitans]|nr:hypothetical protein UYSO10_3001 [Kosakonia radicincitans]
MNNTSLEDRIYAVNWNSSYTAYGPANDVPELLLQLASDDHEEQRPPVISFGADYVISMFLWRQQDILPFHLY